MHKAYTVVIEVDHKGDKFGDIRSERFTLHVSARNQPNAERRVSRRFPGCRILPAAD